MNDVDEERTHLLPNERNGSHEYESRTVQTDDGYINNQIYYDSFPRIVSPDEEDNNPIDEAKPSIQVPDTQNVGQMKTYKRRWYILITYSLFSLAQNGLWNTWGPISSSSEEAFGWHDSTIAWLINWGPIAYVLLGLFFPWLLQVKGLRWAVLSSMVFLAVGSGLRCITSDPRIATILMHTGHFCIGVAGPVAMGAIPALSAIWFPPSERVTATALGTSIGMTGMAISFVLGPALVTEAPPKDNSTTNRTSTAGSSLYLVKHPQSVLEPANMTDARIHKERDQIMWYMYYEGIFCLVLFLLILVYYPAKPPTPPCVSAVAERDEYWSGLWSLRRKGYFLIIALVYGISTGVISCWSSVLYVNLETVNVTQDTAGWIGFYSNIAGSAASLLIGRFANLFARRMKLFILVLYLAGTACFLVFTLMLIKVIPFSAALMWSTIIGGTMFVNAAVPLMYELACELAYPTSEGAANGLLTYVNNVGGLLFLAVFSFPHVGKMWMNWAATGSCFICIPLIGLLKGRFNRLEVDEGVHTEVFVERTLDVDSSDVIGNAGGRGSVQA